MATDESDLDAAEDEPKPKSKNRKHFKNFEISASSSTIQGPTL
jgi:hypothetical protein